MDHSPNDNPQRKRRSNDDRMQYAANIVTVLTGLGAAVGAFTGQLLFLLPAIAAAVFMVYSLVHHRWKSAVFGLIVVVLASVVAFANTPHDQPAAAGAGNQPSTTTTAKSPTQSSDQTPSSTAASGQPKKLVDNDNITLQRSQGIDVDKPDQTPQSADGATGPLDLYFDPGGLPGSLIAHDSETIYGASNTTNPYATCTNAFDPHTSYHNSQPWGGIYAGDGYCFKTSDGHMAWVGVTAKTQPVASESATAVSLHVIVWDKSIE